MLDGIEEVRRDIRFLYFVGLIWFACLCGMLLLASAHRGSIEERIERIERAVVPDSTQADTAQREGT